MAESNKDRNSDSPYVNEDATSVKPSRFAWTKTRPVKIAGGVAAGALVLGATFATGASLGKNLGPGPEGHFGNHAPFDRDGDLQKPQSGQPGGHGPDGHHDEDGERNDDGDGAFQLPTDPNGATAPSDDASGGAVNP